MKGTHFISKSYLCEGDTHFISELYLCEGDTHFMSELYVCDVCFESKIFKMVPELN